MKVSVGAAFVAIPCWSVLLNRDGSIKEGKTTEDVVKAAQGLVRANQLLQQENAKLQEGAEAVLGNNRSTFLKVFKALCKKSGMVLGSRGTAEAIRAATELEGSPASSDAISKILDEAKRL